MRALLGIEPYAFAAVLGVHVSTVYRWESSKAPKIDPLQRQILMALRDRKISHRQGADLGGSVVAALLSGGNLHGLRVLLEFITKDTSHG